MYAVDLLAIVFIVIAALLGACGLGFRWAKRIAGLVIGAIVGGLLLGIAGLVCVTWSPPDSSVDALFRESPVLRLLSDETAGVARRLGIDTDSFRDHDNLENEQ